MNKDDLKLLEENGWEVECEAPFEIRTKDGSFAGGEAADIVLEYLKLQIVLQYLKKEIGNSFTEQDMNDCFNAGVNRGVTIASILLKREVEEEFPTYREYMKRYDED